MATNLLHQIQSFGSLNDQTLVVLHIATFRSDNKSASPSEILRTFIDLSIPPPKNVSQHLAALAKQKFILAPSTGRWRVSQVGAERIRQLTGGVSESLITATLASPDDATIADAPHSLLPWEVAPVPFRASIGRFLEGRQFERNVFGISRSPRKDKPSDVIAETLEVCRTTCADLGLDFHLASDRVVEEMLFSNIVAAMWACRYGIAIIEDTVEEGVNANVILEVGAMLITGRPCLLLKDVSVKKPPSDLVAHLYDEVDISQASSLDDAIRRWAKHRLGI